MVSDVSCIFYYNKKNEEKVEFNYDITQKWWTVMYWKLDTFLKELEFNEAR